MLAAIVISVAIGLAVNEISDVCPWFARALVRWSAMCRYTSPERAAIRAEELSALIDDRPGKLFKLLTACGFAGSALVIAACRRIARESSTRQVVNQAATPAPVVIGSPMPHAEVLAQVYNYLDGGVDEDTIGQIRQHLDQCGHCLREYGLEEAVKRLVETRYGKAVPHELRTRVLARIAVVRAELELEGETGDFLSPRLQRHGCRR